MVWSARISVAIFTIIIYMCPKIILMCSNGGGSNIGKNEKTEDERKIHGKCMYF